jgi:parallel beta-helix repeat protein
MPNRIFSAIMMSLLVLGTLALAFNVQPVKAEGGNIYIRADGSVDPPTAPISTSHNNTYTFTDNISGSIVVNRNNIVLDGKGYVLEGAGSGNGIDLSYVTNVTVQNTQITGFDKGIFVGANFGNSLYENNITNNGGDGIYLYNSSNDDISGNNITKNDYGIALDSSSNNSISRNNIAAYDNAINLYFSSSVNINGNNITASPVGIHLGYSSDVSISGNNITLNSYYGIRLVSTSDVSINGNNITNNKKSGMRLYSSSNNKVYRNNFVNNTQQVYSVDSTNVWDDGVHGNYWNDYNGSDANHDGIGDTPYIIDANNKDNYPLMPPHVPGDLNDDTKVNLEDLVLLALAYGSKPGDSNWNPNADIDGDGVVGKSDLAILAQHYGEHNP